MHIISVHCKYNVKIKIGDCILFIIQTLIIYY